MRIERTKASAASLLDVTAAAWRGATEARLPMIPAPLEAVVSVSPYLARQSGHGAVRELRLRALHDGEQVSLRLDWALQTAVDQPADLDQFTDAAAVMFAVGPAASALTMGAPGQGVNAWLWRANAAEPLEVCAEGYSTSQRRAGSGVALRASAIQEPGRRVLVLQRPLRVQPPDSVQLAAGSSARFAFALWSGANRERSAQKSVSGEFKSVELAP